MPVMDGHTAMTKILESEKAGKPQIVALTANADTVSHGPGSVPWKARAHFTPVSYRQPENSVYNKVSMGSWANLS